MSLKLPLADSPIREKFDMADLVEAARCPRNLPAFREALDRGRAFLRKSPVASAVNFLALSADGSIILLEVKRMSSKRLFNFGDPLK